MLFLFILLIILTTPDHMTGYKYQAEEAMARAPNDSLGNRVPPGYGFCKTCGGTYQTGSKCVWCNPRPQPKTWFFEPGEVIPEKWRKD
eukprot:g1470.t1